MSYAVLEQFIAAKKPGTDGEDLVADLGSFAVVLDGVTGKDGSTYRGLTGGRFAAEVVLDAVGRLTDDIDAASAIREITEQLHRAILAETPSGCPHPPGTQLAVYSAARREVWAVGDIHVRVGDQVLPTRPPPTDEIATRFRAAVLHALLRDGKTVDELAAHDPTWELLLPLLSRQDLFANREEHHPLGYGTINGTPVPDRYLITAAVPAGTEVVLATDGYFSPQGTLAEAEAAIAEVLKTDPLLITEHLGFRPAPPGGSFDDRAWMRIRTA